MIIKLNKYVVFHPISWLVFGYLVWMLVPPAFSDMGFHLETLFYDLFCIIFIVFGIFLGGGANQLLGNKLHINIQQKNIKYLIAAFVFFIYTIKIILYFKHGITVFLHPYSRESSILDTVSRTLQMPYVVLLITLIVCDKKRAVYIFLFSVEIFLNFIPQMSRSIYIYLILYFSFAFYFYGQHSIKKVALKAIPLLLLVLFIVGIFGPFLNSVRSHAETGNFKKGLELAFTTEQIDSKFLINRLNVHGQAHSFSPIIDSVVTLDKNGLMGMFEKWTGISEEYRVHPTSVSTLAGIQLGYGGVTATDFPRSLVLGNYEWPLFMLFSFNVILGAIVGFLYSIIFSLSSRVFLMLWGPLVMGTMFGGGGAPPSTFIFQLIFVVFSLTLLFVIYKIFVSSSKLLAFVLHA